MPVPANPQQRNLTPFGPQDATAAAVATACPASSIAAALSAFDDVLQPYLRTNRRGLPSDVAMIFEAVASELRQAHRWRLANLAGADAAIEAHVRDLAHAGEAAEAVEIVRSCLRSCGRRWQLDLPETAARLSRFVWFDVLAAEHDPVALAAVLARRYPERLSA